MKRLPHPQLPPTSPRPHPRAFTLAETVIAVLILGIGLIMLATVFAVASNWTRQSSEETVGQMIGQTAVTTIQAQFRSMPANFLSAYPSGTTTLAPLPFTAAQLPWRERAYAFGSTTPWPVASTATVPPTYSWLALMRRAPGQVPGIDNRFDVFVFVCKKGQIDQTFGDDSVSLTGRLTSDPKLGTLHYLPYLATTSLASLPVGTRGVGATSGTVFRKLSSSATSLPVGSGENIWYVPASTGTDARSSPVIYVYQSTVSF